MLDRIPRADAERGPQPAAERGACETAIEIEARSTGLFNRGGERRIDRCAKNSPLTVRQLSQVLVEPVPARTNHLVGRRNRRSCRPEADAREQIQRPIPAKQVAPPDLKEASGGHLEFFDGTDLPDL